MTRLRYFVDRPRGPRGGHNDSGSHRSLESARREAEPKYNVLREADGRWRRDDRGEVMREMYSPKGTVLVVDLEELLPVDATVDEHYEWHEARAIHHTAEAMRLRPAGPITTALPRWLSTTELAEIREIVSEWDGIPATSERRKWAERAVCLVLRDLLREGKLG